MLVVIIKKIIEFLQIVLRKLENTSVQDIKTEEPITVKNPIFVDKTHSQLAAMNKLQLEAYGRTIGIELDRRKTKNVLIEQLLQQQKSIKGDLNGKNT